MSVWYTSETFGSKVDTIGQGEERILERRRELELEPRT